MIGWAGAANVAAIAFTVVLVLFVLYNVDSLAMLVVFAIWLVRRHVRRRGPPMTARLLRSEAEQRIAVMVPAWDESDVIRRMLQTMLRRYDYRNYCVFVGVYPNDRATRTEVEAVASADDRIHCVVVSRAGPTTKGDCLNQLYEAALEYGDASGRPFAMFVLNDAEDVVPPLGLRVFNHFIPRYDVVQLPVLPLPVEWWNLTTWHYADEFAAGHARDMPLREWISGAVPSAGVGTGFSRRALAYAAETNGGLPCSLTSLTEDYDLTMRIAPAGFAMTFVFDALFRPSEDRTGWPVDDAIAVREYFPRSFRRAVKQKGRWIAGIVLQGWSALGWPRRAGLSFFLFRDRKVMAGYGVTALGYICVVLSLAVRVGTGHWPVLPTGKAHLALDVSIIFGCVRAALVGAVYGPTAALLSPLRTLWSSAINMLAAGRALWIYFSQRKPRWDKTAHEFPDVTT